jgi:rhodanese-related sulfurtransferase
MKATIRETLTIFGFSVVVAFLINLVSPNGIVLVGNWDPFSGMSSSGPDAGNGSFFQIVTDVDAAKRLYDGGASIFVDARSRDDFDDGHVQNAISLPFGEFGEAIEDFKDRHPVSTPIVTYCSGPHCRDSHKLAELLLMEGYQSIRVFVGGFPAWKDRGYPLE